MSDHVCGWSGPRWLHAKRLCATCKGIYPTVDDGRPRDFSQEHGPPCRTCYPYAKSARFIIGAAMAGRDWFDCWASIDEAADIVAKALEEAGLLEPFDGEVRG